MQIEMGGTYRSRSGDIVTITRPSDYHGHSDSGAPYVWIGTVVSRVVHELGREYYYTAEGCFEHRGISPYDLIEDTTLALTCECEKCRRV